jgi:hypothetical protein
MELVLRIEDFMWDWCVQGDHANAIRHRQSQLIEAHSRRVLTSAHLQEGLVELDIRQEGEVL